FTPTIASQHKPLTLFSAVTLTSLASPPWILPPSLQTRDLFRCHHWFSFTPSGATTVPCLDRTSFSIVVVFVTNWDLQQRVSDLQQLLCTIHVECITKNCVKLNKTKVDGSM
ncbi:hypothetical protein S245_058427, partial [Arachis hypogaea]